MIPLLHTLASLATQPLANLPAQPLIHALGWTLLHFLWQGLLVAALLWFALGLLPAQLSRTRYAAALLALGLMAALPLATFGHLAANDLAASRALALAPIPIDSAIVIRVTPTDAPEPLLPRIQRALDDSIPWLPALWLAGVLLFLARLNFGLLLARRIANAAALAPPADLQRIFDSLRARLGIARAVRLMHSAVVQVPTVIGWLRPVVLVPIGCLAGMSPTQVEAILAHELAHIRRHDYLVSVLQSVVEALLFYQPAVWWVSRQVRRERENCCDDVAVRLAGDPLAYARALSSLEEHRASMPAIALAASGGALKLRIRRLLGYPDDRVALQPVAITLLVVAALAATTYAIAAAHAQPTPKPSAPTASDSTSNPGGPSFAVLSQRAGVPASFAGGVDRVGYRAELDPLSLTSPTPQAQPTAADDASASLPPAYRTWLNEEVLWIITPPERAAFLQLANNEERDRFIEDFWQRRNPVPGSPENSFREEHYARIAYANSHFISDKSAGWKTDRGRAYIVYGKPQSIDVHPASSPSYEVWHYPSIPGLGSNIDLKFVDDDCNCNNYRLMSQTPPPASAQFSQAEKEYREFLATYPNSPEARKRLISIQAASQFAESSRYATFPNVALDLDNPDFQNRLAAAMNAVSRVNSPEFQKHLADARAAAVRLDTIDLQKQLAEASAASGNLRFLLQVEEGKTATNDPESAQRLIATVNSLKFQEQLAQAQVAVATAAAHIDTPEFRQRLDETINAATNLDLEFKAQDRLAQDANSLAQAEAQMPGSIAGKISDPSGAGIPHATVTAIDTDTGARTIRETDASGDYSISPLPPGPYNVDILAAGFKRTLQENVSVKPRQQVRLDLKLSATPAGNAAITPAPPTLISKFDPVYPHEAKAAHVQGAVILYALISKTGSVEKLNVISGVPMLNKSAMDAVARWKYKPYIVNGQPTEVSTTITVNFTYDDQPTATSTPAPPPPPDTGAAPTSPVGAPARVPIASLSGDLISKVDPVYPPEAKAAHVQGPVILHAFISKSGTIEKLEVISGPPMLNDSAMEAVAQWKYKPYIVNGQPVEVSTTITVNFSLADQPTATSTLTPLRIVVPNSPTTVRLYDGREVPATVISPVPRAEDQSVATTTPNSQPTIVVNSTAADGAAADTQAAQQDRDLTADLRKIGGPVSAPVLRYAAEPKFSEAARKAKLSGTVLITLIVDQNGLPQNVHVVRGVEIGRDGKPNPDLTDEARAAAATLDQNAVDAVKQYKFKPAMEADKPVPVLLNVEVNYKLF